MHVALWHQHQGCHLHLVVTEKVRGVAGKDLTQPFPRIGFLPPCSSIDSASGAGGKCRWRLPGLIRKSLTPPDVSALNQRGRAKLGRVFVPDAAWHDNNLLLPFNAVRVLGLRAESASPT